MLSNEKQIKLSLLSALVFLLISSPEMYRVTSNVLGNWIANAAGCPTAAGLLTHTAVFGLIVYALMKIKSRRTRTQRWR